MTAEPPILYCANHPTVETSLRCNNCEKPICPRCAVLTPTGYRCRDCVRSQQKVFDTALWYDFPISFFVAAFLSYLGTSVVGFISFFIIFLAPIAGMVIAETIRFVTRKRRSTILFRVATLGVALGSLPPLLMLLLSMAFGGRFALLGLIWYALYTFIVTSTVYYRLRGINIR